MKKDIKVFDYANEIMQALEKGVLLTTRTEEKVNTMTISWGSLGIEWGRPIFIAYVRENRYTKRQLDKCPEFTVNIPLGDYNKKIIGVCGTKSGYQIDKINEMNLTLESPKEIQVPGIKELPLTLECKVIYQHKQEKEAIPNEINEVLYPQDVEGTFHGANKDYHTVYYGEIVSAYIID